MNSAHKSASVLYALATLLVLLFTVTGCVSTGIGPAVPATSANVLKVGITANAPPLIYRQDGRITGLEAEFAVELARYTGRELRFVEISWDDQIPSLVAGRTDIIMSGMSVTELRQYRIMFADPYLVSGQVALVRRNEFNRFSNGLTDLLNLTVRIGSVAATTGSYLAQKQFAGNSKMEYTTPQQAVKALIGNKIDAFVYDLPMNFYFGALHEAQGLVPVPAPLTREYLAWGIRKDDPGLLAAANGYLANIRESGQLQEKVQRWIPFYTNLYNQ